MINMFFDTETTGRNIETAKIISFSYVLCVDDKEIERETIEMCPFDDIKETEDQEVADALSINGYKPEQIMQFQPYKQGLEKILSVFIKAKAINNGYPPRIIGYNNNGYDMPLIRKEWKRLNIIIPENSIGFKQIDVMQICWGLDAMGLMPVKKNPITNKNMGCTLKESVSRMEITADETQFHGSMYDTEMTKALYHKLKQVLKIDL
jgi:DNA polymerase III epsilon subunit-like protein